MLAWSRGTYPPLSFDRPEPLNRVFPGEQITDPMRGSAPCTLAPAEWRLLGWLEREGFGYDLYAETQLHDTLLDLDRYRVLVLSTHPEYWTREMYDPGAALGSRTRRETRLPRRQRHQLRGRVPRRRADGRP